MIIQSPESPMPEPYRTYVRQRSESIAHVMSAIVDSRNVQLCPHAVTSDERVFNSPADIVYGAVVRNKADGLKSVLYGNGFGIDKKNGVATDRIDRATEYAEIQFRAGNRVRVKDAAESDGRGQAVVESVHDLENAFNTIVRESFGLVVVMPHIETITHRISVGRIALGDIGNFVYFGQEETQFHDGEQVYGGTVLGLFRSDSKGKQEQALDTLGIPQRLAQLGMRALRDYQAIALSADRVSVDVIEGLTDNGSLLTDVVDLTPRVGGTTPAEVLAMRELHTRSDAVCFARSRLIYNPKRSLTTGTNFVDTDSLVINAEVLEVK